MSSSVTVLLVSSFSSSSLSTNESLSASSCVSKAVPRGNSSLACTAISSAWMQRKLSFSDPSGFSAIPLTRKDYLIMLTPMVSQAVVTHWMTSDLLGARMFPACVKDLSPVAIHSSYTCRTLFNKPPSMAYSSRCRLVEVAL